MDGLDCAIKMGVATTGESVVALAFQKTPMHTPHPAKPCILPYILRAVACIAFIVSSSGAAAAAVPGSVVAWGYNAYGQSTVPAGLSGVVAIAAGEQHTVALKQNGAVVAWGATGQGQTNVPPGLSGVVAIAAGSLHTLALKSAGTVVAWGRNDEGQSTVPAGLSNVVAIAAGYLHTAALKNDGTVVAWGGNDLGQTNVPPGLSGVVAIAAGGSASHTVALKSDGTVVAWGLNNQGQTNVPPGLSGVVAIAAGGQHTVALKQDGRVVAWGAGMTNTGLFPHHGQSIVPGGLSNVVAIAAGAVHTLALKNDGAVVAWGANAQGQRTVPGLSGVVAIAAGSLHSVVIRLRPPNVYEQPTSRIVNAGQSASFSVMVNGIGLLSYQWLKDTREVPGATNDTHTIPVVDYSDAGNYSVVVDSEEGSVTSHGAALAVVDWPIFTTHPVTQMVGVGSNVMLSATAYGVQPQVFQWYFNDSPIGAPITGENVASLALTNVQTNKSGKYSVTVLNGYGSATSSNATLTVVVFPPKIATQPASQNPLRGNSASLTVSVGGTPPFQYRWQFNHADIPGATNAVYTIAAVAESDAGEYSVVVVNSAGSASSGAQLRVIVPPTLRLTTLAGYPLLSLNGMLRSNFNVEYSPSLATTNWLNLRSFSNLSVSPYQFLDTSGSTQPARYYRAVMH